MKNDVTAEVKNLHFGYGHRVIFSDFSTTIPRGISLGLLGGSGSGKTTLMKLIVGLERPKSGEINIFGTNLTNETRLKIGYMPQQNAIYNDLTVQQNVDFFACMYGMSSKAIRLEAVNDVLNAVGLWERRNDSVSSLSGGMQRRASLACVLTHQPSFLLLDEPTVGLDPDMRVDFWQYFNKLTDNGMTLFITSHTMDDAMHCDRLIFLKEGQIIAEDTPKNLIMATGNPEASLEDSFIHFNSKESIHDS